MLPTPPTSSATKRSRESANALLRFWSIITEHVKLIVACMLVATAVAVVYTRLAPRRYSAEAQMLVSPASAADSVLANLPVLHETSDPTRDMLTAAGLVATPQVAQAAINALNLKKTPSALLADVTATPIGNSNLLAIQAVANSATEAQRLANEFTLQVIATRTAALHAAEATLIPELKAQIAAESPAERVANASLSAELSELQQLNGGPDPTITLAAPAALPLAPYTPRTKLAIVAGLIAGLVLGVGGAFLVDAVDPRLRREDQLREMFNARILAIVPRDSRRRYRRRRSSSGPLLPGEFSFGVHESFRSLRTFVAARASGGSRAVLLTGSAPGEGKTTSAVGLAAALAQGGASVILIEADFRRPVIARALHIDLAYGTEHVAAGVIDLAHALTTVEFDHAEVHVVAVQTPNDHVSELLTFDFAQRLIDESKALADFVVIDSAPVTAVVDALPLVRFVDDVLIVSRLGVSKLARVAELCDLLNDYGMPPQGFVVVSDAPMHGSLYYSAAAGQRVTAPEVAPVGLESPSEERG